MKRKRDQQVSTATYKVLLTNGREVIVPCATGGAMHVQDEQVPYLTIVDERRKDDPKANCVLCSFRLSEVVAWGLSGFMEVR